MHLEQIWLFSSSLYHCNYYRRTMKAVISNIKESNAIVPAIMRLCANEFYIYVNNVAAYNVSNHDCLCW